MAAYLSRIPLWKSEIFWKNPRYSSKFLSSIASVSDSDAYVDCLLTVDEKKIPCHKIILAATSPYFHLLFTSGFKESNQKETSIKGFSFGVISAVIHYIYSGTLDLADEDLGELLLATNMLQMEGLQSICIDLILKQMDPVNAIDAYHFCCGHESLFTKIQVGSKALILKEFYQIYLNEGLVILSTKEFYDIISSGNLMVQNEWQVVESILKWIERKQKLEGISDDDICYLMKALHFDRLNPTEVESLKNHDICRQSSVVLDCLNNLHEQQIATTHRLGQQKAKFLIGGNFVSSRLTLSEPTINVNCVDVNCQTTIETRKLSEISSLPIKLQKSMSEKDFAMGVLRSSEDMSTSKLYWLVMMNEDKSNVLKVYVYHKLKNVWSTWLSPIVLPFTATVVTSTICKDYLVCLLNASSFMLYCICLSSGQLMTRNLVKENTGPLYF